MKKMKVWDNPEELRKELQRIADELGLPIDDEKVGLAWVGNALLTSWEI